LRKEQRKYEHYKARQNQGKRVKHVADTTGTKDDPILMSDNENDESLQSESQ